MLCNVSWDGGGVGGVGIPEAQNAADENAMTIRDRARRGAREPDGGVVFISVRREPYTAPGKLSSAEFEWGGRGAKRVENPLKPKSPPAKSYPPMQLIVRC